MKYAILIAALLCAAPIHSHGDVLEVTGRESFSGNVVRIVEGTLVFKSSLSGRVMVPMDRVAALSTDHNLMLTLTDGSVVYGRLGHSDTKNRLSPLGGGEALPIDLATVDAGVVIPNSAGSGSEGGASGWSATAGGGVLLRGGSESGFSPAAHLDISREGLQGIFDSSLLLAPGGEGDFPEYLRGTARLSSAGEAAGPFAELRVDRNTDAALLLRSELNLGLRWPVLRNKNGKTEAFAGFSLAYEQWEMRRRFLTRSFDVGLEEEEISLHLGLRYAEGGFQAEMAVYPNLEDGGEFRIRANGSYARDITPSLGLRLDLLLDYDSAPPFAGMSDWEAALGASLELGF